MARNTVTLTFAGDASSLSKTFTSVGSDATTMGGKVDKASKEVGSGFARMNDGASGATTHFRGTADVVDGLGTVLGATALGPMAGMAMGFADIADGIGTSVLPALKNMAVFLKGMTVSSVAATVATAAQTVAQWALNIAMNANPIGLIITGLALLVGAVVLVTTHWDTLKDVAVSAFNVVKVAVGDGVGFILGAVATMFRAVAETAGHLPFVGDNIKRSLMGAVDSIEAFRVSAHDGFTSAADRLKEVRLEANRVEDAIQTVAKLGHAAGVSMGTTVSRAVRGYAAGGVVPGPTGMPQLAVLHGGETIIPAGGGGNVTYNITVSGVGMGRDFGLAVAQATRDNKLIGIA